ncbi:hypothetical protein PG988_004632 [Apiospora saccharicola]
MSSPEPQSRPTRPRAAAGEIDQDDGGRPEEAKGGYSHDATVAAITSMFAYVSELYGCELSYPPPGAGSGLTDRVLSLMRHIPYFRSGGPELMFSTYPADHQERFLDPELKSPETEEEKTRAQERKELSEETYEDHLPPHLVVLTTGHPWRCYTILIDTELGAVRFWDRYDGSEFPTEVPGDLGYEDDAEDVAEDGPDSWKAAPRYRISTFFDLWRKEFLDWNKELMYRGDGEEEGSRDDVDEQETKGEVGDDQGGVYLSK